MIFYKPILWPEDGKEAMGIGLSIKDSPASAGLR